MRGPLGRQPMGEGDQQPSRYNQQHCHSHAKPYVALGSPGGDAAGVPADGSQGLLSAMLATGWVSDGLSVDDRR